MKVHDRFFDWYYYHQLDYRLKMLWIFIIAVLMMLSFAYSYLAVYMKEWDKATWWLVMAFILGYGLPGRPR
jgi:hypothetical protein